MRVVKERRKTTRSSSSTHSEGELFTYSQGAAQRPERKIVSFPGGAAEGRNKRKDRNIPLSERELPVPSHSQEKGQDLSLGSSGHCSTK